jgi:hypothetical protein
MEKHTVFFTEANPPDNHIVNQEYNAFLDKFEEGNLIVVELKTMLFTPKAFASWNKLMTEIKAQKKST